MAAVACRCSDAVRPALFEAARNPGDGSALGALVRALSEIDPGRVSELSILEVYEALADSVAWARYWQEPIEEDRLLASPALDAVLEPIGERILGHEAAADWEDDLVGSRQRYVQWSRSPPPRLVGARRSLAKWHSDVLEEEARALRERPADPLANFSGTWWSAPPRALLSTSPGYDWLGATDLILTEDEPGWERATIWPMEPTGPVRVFEIATAADWVRLVEAAPVDVSRSRLHDWYRAAGRVGDWFIPDWLQLSDRYDGIHLKVTGYLETAGRFLPVGSGGTLLAGWNPGATYWLTDCLAVAGPPSRWERRSSESADRRWHVQEDDP
ncbi:MAG TPA: hypothetical protein VF329_06085 [Gammaproteobacteria bacterium]